MGKEKEEIILKSYFLYIFTMEKIHEEIKKWKWADAEMKKKLMEKK
jgi:hypothetical protein